MAAGQRHGTIYYKLNTDTSWKTAQNSEFTVQKEGTYQVKIIDKSGKESYVKDILVGKIPEIKENEITSRRSYFPISRSSGNSMAGYGE